MRLCGVLRGAVLFAFSASLFGCSSSVSTNTPAPANPPGASTTVQITGKVNGGQQPVSGATVQLYAVGTNGDGSAATALLTEAVTTDQNGAFNVMSGYTCPSQSSQLYLVATGGNPGLASGTNNKALAMMTALGSCSSVSAPTTVLVNELTTVGSMATLFPYAAGYASIGSASSDSAQMNAAFNTVGEYVNTASGTVPGPGLPANTYASSTEIDTLGDILSGCIDSAGGVANDGSACGRLFALTTPASGTAPTDTITAVVNILKNPTANVAALFGLAPGAEGPFQPSLLVAPADWTLPVVPIPAVPTFSVPSGTYGSAQSISLSDATPGASIYYTADGSIPTTSSPLSSGAIPLSTSATIKAFASEGGRAASAVVSATYTINLPPATITAAAGSGQSALVGTAFATPLQVKVLDSNSKPVVGVAVGFSASITGAAASFSSPTCTTDANGVCSVTATANLYGGSYSVLASAGSLSTSFTLTNTPLLPASIIATTGSGQSALVGTAFATPLQVKVLDSNSKPVAGVAVGFSSSLSGAGVTFSASTCMTDVTGSCSVTATANQVGGTSTVMASVGALSTSFTLTNTGPHAYVVTVATDTTTGVATNCVDQSGSAGDNTNCSLRDALAAAAANASSTLAATITFAQTSASTITLANGTLNIPSYTTIQGATSGSGATLSNLITVDGDHASAVFTEASGVAQASINNLTITHGSATLGGGIYTSGSLSVSSSTFTADQATDSGGAISNNGGTLTLFGDTFANNTATLAYGGAVDNYGHGTLTVSNSTFAANQGQTGGALYSSGTATVIDSTISGNTGTYGGGVYNLGTMTVRNSIVNGNSNEDCGGIYCAPLWVYVVFSAATPTPVDASNITIAFSDSLGNTFSQTVTYGQYSTPASLASAFGPYFYYNTSGLDTTGITGESFGSMLVISPTNGATLSPLAITNLGSSFTATQETFPFLLSGNNNVYGVTSAQVNLSPLGNNGGPTQTMVPLVGSTALCAINLSTATGTDQRGQPRTVTVGSSTCQDAGAVQTSN
jgi:trimeric autotransporter adhesin